MRDVPEHAILQRDGRTYAVVPRIPIGVVTPELLESLASVARRYGVPVMKITSGQRIALVGIEPEKVADLWDELSLRVGPAQEMCVHYVQACPGTGWCRFGQRDSIGLGLRIEEAFVGVETPAKVKFGISGCPFNCSESYVRDVGAFAKKKGWTVVFGGNSGKKPRIGDRIAEDVDEDAVVELARRLIDFYRANAKEKERTHKLVERIGIEAVRAAVG
jgi:NAD(P)H-nitrite reductase large subunit